jgi:hypothetical protein
VHFGGGTWWDGTSDFGTTIPGRSQHGFIQLMGLGEMVANPTNVDLYIDGIDGGVIEMPTETVWHVNISISVMEYDYNVTDFTGKVATAEFCTMLWRDKVTHYSSTPVKISNFHNGFANNSFIPHFPIVSNKIAPYLQCKHTGHTAVISATIQYTQSKFQRIPII